MICEMALRRWCESHAPLTEEQVHEMTLAKQKLMEGFNPDDPDAGYFHFARKLEEAGRAVCPSR